ncbi:MAG: hypothetical protein KFF77_01855 [Bacteroidetes bacterium]|nr:hypothetical protein [Bacteroidota bacterium]
MRRIIFHISVLPVLFVLLAPALRAQGDLRPYMLPRVGEVFEASESEYFLLFPEWTGYGEATVRPARIRVWRTATDSILFQRHDPTWGSILVSDSAALALWWYLDHFETLRQGDSPMFFSTSEKVPGHLHRGMLELYERKVLPPWWPGWSRDDGENLVHVTLSDGGSLRGRILGMTNRRLLLWQDSASYAETDIPTHLHAPRWDEIGSIRVPDKRMTELGWAGMYTALVVANLLAGADDRHRKDVDGIANFFTNLGRVFFVGIGALGFWTPDPIVTEYRTGSSDDADVTVTRHGSPLRDAQLLRPGLPPEILAKIDTSAGELLLSGSDPLPLWRVPRADETTMPSGFWVGVEQLWLSQTQNMGFRTGASAGYVLPLTDLEPERIRLGMDAIVTGVTGYRDFGSAGIRGFLQVHWLRLGAGIRGMVMGEKLHTTTYGRSNWGDSYGSSTVLYQHGSRPGHYMYGDFGFDIALRKMSIGVRHLLQFVPSGYTVENWRSYDMHSGERSGQSIVTGIRLNSVAVSLQVWW